MKGQTAIAAVAAWLALLLPSLPALAIPAGRMEVFLCPAGTAASRGVSAEIVRSREGIGYRIRIDGRWRRGAWTGSGIDAPRVIVADLDFDGHPDIWVTGDADGQGRARPSDVWLFDPATRRHRLDSRLSALPNLDVDPAARQLESGVTCGCAGACFRIDRLARVGKGLRPVSRIEQTCGPDGAAVVGWRLTDGTLRRVEGRPAPPLDGRPAASPGLIDWRRGTGCTRR